MSQPQDGARAATQRADRGEVVLYVPARSFGGAERVTLDLAARLPAHGWRATIVCSDLPGLEQLVSASRAVGVAVVPLRSMTGVRAVVQLRGLLRRLRPTVFHAQLGWPAAGVAGLAAAALSGVPRIVVTEHLYLDPPRRARIAHRILAHRVHAYVAVSEAIAAELVASLRLPQERIRVIRNGIDVDWYASSGGSIPDELAHPAGARVVAVARLRPQKGIDVLLEAAATLPEAEVVIVGEGPELETLQALARDRGISGRVRFTGFRSDVRPFIHAADVVVLPSRAEGLPLVALEAMAARRPLVATDVGGTREAVADGVTGVLVPPDDVAALAAAIRGILSDPEAATRSGAAGASRVRELFAVERMVADVAATYGSTETRASRGRRDG